jgi:hypothetical protein
VFLVFFSHGSAGNRVTEEGERQTPAQFRFFGKVVPQLFAQHEAMIEAAT